VLVEEGGAKFSRRALGVLSKGLFMLAFRMVDLEVLEVSQLGCYWRQVDLG
jgi:hypothetical protein